MAKIQRTEIKVKPSFEVTLTLSEQEASLIKAVLESANVMLIGKEGAKPVKADIWSLITAFDKENIMGHPYYSGYGTVENMDKIRKVKN